MVELWTPEAFYLVCKKPEGLLEVKCVYFYRARSESWKKGWEEASGQRRKRLECEGCAEGGREGDHWEDRLGHFQEV